MEIGNHKVYYFGRLWDATMTDGAIKTNEPPSQPCMLCQMEYQLDEDIIIMPFMHAHVECHLRVSLGDVAHLEARCSCFNNGEEHGEDDKPESFRDSARATLQWLIDHQIGRFK